MLLDAQWPNLWKKVFQSLLVMAMVAILLISVFFVIGNTPLSHINEIGFGLADIVIFSLFIGGVFLIGWIWWVRAEKRATKSMAMQSEHSYTHPQSYEDPALQERQDAFTYYVETMARACIAQTALEHFIEANAKLVDMAGFLSYTDTFKQKLDAYQSRCHETIAAGRMYMPYFNADSDERSWLLDNEDTLMKNIQVYADYYDELLSDYRKSQAKIDAYDHYNASLARVQSTLNDFKEYSSSGIIASSYEKWVNGLGIKVNSFAAACNEAVSAGRAYQQYLEHGSVVYQAIVEMEQKLTRASTGARMSYSV